MATMTELIICSTCRTADTPRDQRADGEILLETVQAQQAFGRRLDWAAVHVRGVPCTGGCSRACTVAFQAPGKHSYQFGGLHPVEASARALLDCAVLHHQSPDGNLARDARPPLLHKGLLCRLPPYQADRGSNPDRSVADGSQWDQPHECDSDEVNMPEEAFGTQQRDGVYRAIYERRDMRHFAGGTVPEAVMRRLLDAAHHAPSVGFMQPWRFVRVVSRELRAELQALVERERIQTGNALGGRAQEFLRLKVEGLMDAAEVWVVALAENREEHVFGRRTMPQMDLASTACAIQNLWLAARAEGLGMGWVSMFDPLALASLMGMPAGAEPVAILCIGPVHQFYEEPMLQQQRWARRSPLEHVLYEESWGQPLVPRSLPVK